MKKNSLLNKVLLFIVTIQTILMGLLFIVQILRIYYGNNQTFTREICGKYLLQILPVIIMWIVVIIGSYIYYKKTKSFKENSPKMMNISKLQSLERICPNNDNAQLKKEANKRMIASIINIVVVIICSIMGLCYLVNPNHFIPSGNLLEQAIQMGIHLSPWIVISLISIIIRMLYVELSARTSIDIIKQIIKSEGKNSTKFEVSKNQQLILLVSRISIFAIAIIFIIIGSLNGGADSVLEKAVNICTECIGLG